MKEDYSQVFIEGFDSYGEPEIRILDEGGLYLVFNFMPPLDENGEDREDPIFENFDEELAKVLDVKVIWEDNEFFLIPEPKPDTVERAKVYLENFWKNHK